MNMKMMTMRMRKRMMTTAPFDAEEEDGDDDDDDDGLEDVMNSDGTATLTVRPRSAPFYEPLPPTRRASHKTTRCGASGRRVREILDSCREWTKGRGASSAFVRPTAKHGWGNPECQR